MLMLLEMVLTTVVTYPFSIHMYKILIDNACNHKSDFQKIPQRFHLQLNRIRFQGNQAFARLPVACAPRWKY